jgi:putative transposase
VSRYVDECCGRFGVEPICRTLGVSVSAYYQRRRDRRSKRAVEDERLLARIRELHAANYYAYGCRRMWKTLGRAGEQVPRCRVQRLMKSNGIVGAKRRGKRWRTTRPDPLAQRRPDLVQRDFAAARPNELWVADLSHLRCWEGLVFFAFVIDAFSRMIVGWQLASHMRTDLVLDALKMALGQRSPGADVELIHHSDRGSLGSTRAFAALCGVSPIEASSGKTKRHRLNKGGDRQGNNALWTIANNRLIHHPESRAYAARRTAEGLSRRKILRCLKRHLARRLYRLIVADLTAAAALDLT